MKNETMKSAIVGGWVLTLGAVAMSVNLASIGGWSLLLAVGLVPPVVLLMQLRNRTDPSMSEAIQKALGR
jgi:hypothetical protein